MLPTAVAQRALQYTRSMLGSLPSNHIVQQIATLGASGECVAGVRAQVRALRDFDRIMNIRRRAAQAKRSRCGNCGEYAAVAFDFMMLTGCPHPIEYAYYSAPGDHAFVIVGRPANTDVANPHTWGRDVVVCDAWSGQVVRSVDYWIQMPGYPRRVHAPAVDVRWSGLGDHPSGPLPSTLAA